MSRSSLVLPLAAAACFSQTWVDGSALFPAETDAGATSSAATSTGTSEATGEPWQTVTSDTPPTDSTGPATSSSTSAGPADQPPEIFSFTVEPDTLHEAGTAEALAVVSADVVSLALRVDGEEVWAGPPSEFAWTFAATSKAASEGTYTLELIARDGEGLTASATAMLWVTLPDTGAEKCVFTEDLGPGWLTAAVYADDALVVVGALASPSLAATVWRLDPDSCQPQAGYPWNISQWTALPQLQTPSQAVGLALDAEGRMAVAANVGSGLSRRPYVAVLSPEGALEWEHLGPMGQTYSGITAAPDRFVVVGETLVSEAPLRYDGLVESFDGAGTKVWSDVIAAPLPGDNFPGDPTTFDEHPRAITWQKESQTLLIVGERLVNKDINVKWTRAFSVRYTGNGALIGAWTSSGLDGDEDGLLAVSTCGEHNLAAGWVGSGPNSRTPATRWLDPLGNGDKRRLDNLADASMRGAACDREQKVSAVATTVTSAYAIGFRASDDPFVFKHLFPQAALTTVDCDSRGFCAAAGLLGDRAWVRVHHP